MEKWAELENGENVVLNLKLPIGFRFSPTDEELIVHYLKRRALPLPLPASIIPDFNVFITDPWALPGDLREKRYFFLRRKWSFGKRIIGAGCGYWKLMGKGKQIVESGNGQVVGTRRRLGFFIGKHPNGTRTSWVMHMFHLLEPNSPQNPVGEEGEWVVCLIFWRKMRPKRHGNCTSKNKKDSNLGIDYQSIIDFEFEGSFDLGPPQPCSPCASDLTEI
ncbi:hypothetical protein Droror1_Dr00014101 [Drosera rotundifolia]